MRTSRLAFCTFLSIALAAGAVLGTGGPASAARLSGPAHAVPAARQVNRPHQLRSTRHRMPAHSMRRTPRQTPLVFAIRPVTGGAAGSVTVTAVRGGYRVTVSVGSLPAYSMHSLHVHAGSCAGPYVGVHLYVLGTLAANRNGAGQVSYVLPYSPAVAGHYLIVYAGPFAGTIAACADL